MMTSRRQLGTLTWFKANTEFPNRSYGDFFLTSLHKYLTSRYKDSTRQYKDQTSDISEIYHRIISTKTWRCAEKVTSVLSSTV